MQARKAYESQKRWLSVLYRPRLDANQTTVDTVLPWPRQQLKHTGPWQQHESESSGDVQDNEPR